MLTLKLLKLSLNQFFKRSNIDFAFFDYKYIVGFQYISDTLFKAVNFPRNKCLAHLFISSLYTNHSFHKVFYLTVMTIIAIIIGF